MIKDIDTLIKLRKEVDAMYGDVSEYCFNCVYKCCQGFINVMPREINSLLEEKIEIVAINENVFFLNNFDNDEKNVPILNVFAPKCRLRDGDKRCLINTNKPIVCSLYPIIPDRTSDGTLSWALHMDCTYSKHLKSENKIDEIKEAFSAILDRITLELYSEIKESFELVDAICSYPNGYNKTIKIREV